MKDYFTRGEFAKMNGTSLFTLRLYDKMGILKPAFTDRESGYHYYSVLQSQQLMSINLCIKAGFSLKEIQRLQKKGVSEKELRGLPQALETSLEQKLKCLSSGLSMVQSLQYYAIAWQTHGLNNPFLEEHISFQGFLSERKTFSGFRNASEHNAFLKQTETIMGHPLEFPYSFLIWETGSEPELQILIRTSEQWKEEGFFRTPPEQTFLIVAFEGDYRAVPDQLEQLRAYAEKREIETADYAMLTPVQRHLFASQGDPIIFVLGIPVRTKTP